MPYVFVLSHDPSLAHGKIRILKVYENDRPIRVLSKSYCQLSKCVYIGAESEHAEDGEVGEGVADEVEGDVVHRAVGYLAWKCFHY